MVLPEGTYRDSLQRSATSSLYYINVASKEASLSFCVHIRASILALFVGVCSAHL
jgi:hypothetical protein